MSAPKCPSCDAQPVQVAASPASARTAALGALATTIFHCQKCGAVLSVQAEPFAMSADLVKKLLEALAKRDVVIC